MLLIRDVNSQEIAFPSRESQFPGLDQDSRFRPVPFTGVIGVGLSAGTRRAGQGIVGPRSDAAGQSVDVAGGWAHQAAGSGWVSGTVAHLSKRRRAARRGKAIANQTGMPGTGDPRPAVRRGRIGRHLSGLS